MTKYYAIIEILQRLRENLHQQLFHHRTLMQWQSVSTRRWRFFVFSSTEHQMFYLLSDTKTKFVFPARLEELIATLLT